MIEMNESTVVKRSVEDVFAYVTDWPRWPEWRMALSTAKQTTEGPIGPGTIVAVAGQVMGRDMSMDVEITSFEVDESIGFHTGSGPILLDGTFRFEAVPEGTKLAVVGKAEPAGVLRLAAPLVARQVKEMWERDLAALKGVLEG